MSEQEFFRNKEEELERLTQEIADLKSTMKEMAASLARIEKHVKRSFGIAPKNKPSVKGKSTNSNLTKKKEEPTITPEEALSIFDDLAKIGDDNKLARIEGKLREMSSANLRLIAHELGITFKSKPSKKTLCSGIMGRLKERSMLSKNLNITAPRAGSENEDV